jgi:hypothetical protein
VIHQGCKSANLAPVLPCICSLYMFFISTATSFWG